MGASVLDCDGVEVEADPTSATWRLTAAGGAYTIREWTWGERRRLIATAMLGDGADAVLDRDAFVAGFVALVAEPEPAPELRPVVAAGALRLLGAHPGRQVPPLLESEAALARAFGWGVAELDGQPAPRLDQHAARLGGDAGAPPGWNSILVGDG